ncbi:MAG: putative zinc-binding protein [Rhodanobacter sp.]
MLISSAAQMAKRLALQRDRARVPKMTYISGVGGGVPGLVRTAQSGRRILALDGCVLKCAEACLAGVVVLAGTPMARGLDSCATDSVR